LHFVERSRWDTETLETIVRPLQEIPTVEEKTPLVEVINSLEELNIKRVSVLSPAETVAGVIDRGDIVRAVARKLNLAIPPAAIQRIKAEGVYPPGFQLVEIAKTLSSVTNT
ncbi:CBS domain-containing protein, partial [Moorena sp. SIO2C4]|uniref:CBS domain-containing protein n=1 Tax=Moorena sp. SIO2C4 TaxID=2607824 RepID=UPI0013CD90EE|nr:site-2 protease family protein [Moorena sp. SIO2C4]